MVLIQASFIHFCPPNYFSTYCREEVGLLHNIPCETRLSESSFDNTRANFDDLLTVQLSVIPLINQLDAQIVL